jgi:cell fate regulator YaaT (PSP1 superfamily)
MPTVVGVKLRYAPKTLWFDPVDTTPAEGETVVVETERGTEAGLVVQPPHDVAESELPAPLKPVLRVATDDDLDCIDLQTAQERDAMPVFRELVNEYQLDMKPIDVELLFGGDKMVFYFVAEERVDFRDLVKDLAARFKVRVDMRQVGVRDEARMIGGLGHCGEQLCCVRFGGEFQPVSIRMAKEQDLPLNPLKISGLCGRLMCCLRYEFEAYKDYKQRAPKRGAIIETPLGLAKVAELNTPHETVGMRLEDGKRFTVALKDMGCCKGTGCPCSVSREVLEEAGGPGMALAFAALDRENEPAAPPAAAPPKPRQRRASGRSEQQAEAPTPAEPAEKREAAEPPARKRRRRGSRGAGNGSAEAQQSPKAAPPAPKADGDTPAEGGSARPARRRRRRRPGSGGSGSEGAPSA